MNREKYLRRIGIEKNDLAATADDLGLLQRRHLLHVPFENLDIHWKRPIDLDEDAFYKKIVERRRGGFCYELNGLFAALLDEIGFQSRLVSARVHQTENRFGAEYDHLAILTRVGVDAEYLVDVGFGSFAAAPLRFVPDIEQKDENGTFIIRKYDENYFEVAVKNGENWKSEYIFSPRARSLADFTGMCGFHQTSPESHFTRGKVCSLMTGTGRKTLTDRKFIETRSGRKIETDVETEEEFERILTREFGIEREAETARERG